jgi:hypothetical protein
MPKLRYPLVQAFMSRDGSLGSKDAYVQNGYMDKYNDKFYVIKRPGTTQFVDLGVLADPKGAFYFNGLIYGVYNDTLYRSGGAVSTGANGTVWTQAPVPVWYGRSFFTATVFQDRIYVIGGEATQLRSDVSYTSDGLLWSTNAGGAPFGHRQGHACVVFNNQLWLIGGFQNDSTTTASKNDVWVTSDGATWDLVTSNAAWTARVNHSVIAGNNGMYLYGGNVAGTMSDEVWFSVDGKTWTNLTLAATGTGRQAHNSLFFQNKLWIIGGQNTAATRLNDVWSSFDGQTWVQETAAAFAAGRSLMAATVYNNKMWLVAGTGAAPDANVYSSSNGMTWTLVTTTPGFTARGGAAAVTFKTPSSINLYRYDTMWLLGGNDGVSELQQVWRANLNSALATTYALSPTTTGLTYDFNTFLNGTKMLIKNASNFWVLESGTLTKIVDTNYPALTVPGIVVLNSFAYVMTPEGEIRSCALDNPLLWPSLQFIDANYEDDPGIAIAKYLNYLVAFGQYTTQFFYDAGLPAPGVAIAPYQGATIKIGCAFAATIQGIQNTLIWVGQTHSREWSVYTFDGLNPKKVSTSWVDKVIDQNLNSGVTSWVTGAEGHSFYVLNLSANFALAYDMNTQQWGIWDSSGGLPYSFGVTTFNFGGDLWAGKGPFGGKLFSARFDIYDDAGTPFDLVVQTDKLDGGNLERKFCGRLDFVADTNPATVTVNVSDDDYATFQTWGTVNLATMRPYLNRGGSFRRRAFKVIQTDSNPARWESLELTISQGES